MTERKLCLEGRDCLKDCCETCLQDRLNHSSCGGRNAAYAEIIGLVKKEAMEAWIQGGARENVGKAFRDLAVKLEGLKKPISEELDEFIQRSRSRR